MDTPSEIAPPVEISQPEAPPEVPAEVQPPAAQEVSIPEAPPEPVVDTPLQEPLDLPALESDFPGDTAGLETQGEPNDLPPLQDLDVSTDTNTNDLVALAAAEPQDLPTLGDGQDIPPASSDVVTPEITDQAVKDQPPNVEANELKELVNEEKEEVEKKRGLMDRISAVPNALKVGHQLGPAFAAVLSSTNPTMDNPNWPPPSVYETSVQTNAAVEVSQPSPEQRSSTDLPGEPAGNDGGSDDDLGEQIDELGDELADQKREEDEKKGGVPPIRS